VICRVASHLNLSSMNEVWRRSLSANSVYSGAEPPNQTPAPPSNRVALLR